MQTDFGWLPGWDPCDVSPVHGTAFFDGLFLRTDAMTDPRWDRVLSVFEEEQVAVCRLMKQQGLFGPGKRVLDLGTGCGVYAIAAAKAGCQVVALDSSVRAYDMAARNAKTNLGRERVWATGRRLPEKTDPLLTDGEIALMHLDFRQYGGITDLSTDPLPPAVDLPSDLQFDVVVLSTPYTPTHPDVDRWVAFHASAGPLGQDRFREQILWMPLLVREGGTCAGNQMTLVTDDGGREIFDLEERFKEAFGGRGRLQALRLLSEDQLVSEFLAAQYRNLHGTDAGYLDGLYEAAKWAPDDERKRTTKFCLLYYVYTRTNEPWEPMTVSPFRIAGRPPEEVHQWKWKHRIQAHRHFVNHTESPGTRSLPRLFAESAAEFVPTANPKRVDKDATDEPIQCDVTNIQVLLEVDKYIQREDLKDLFSVIFIDGAPLHGSQLSRLREECAVWLEGTWKSEVLKGMGREGQGLKLLRAWQEATLRLWKVEMGPIAHPAFVGMSRYALPFRHRWPSIQASQLPNPRPADARLQQAVESDYVRQLLAATVDATDVTNSAIYGENLSMCKGTFEKLGTGAVARFQRAVADRVYRLKGRFPEYSETELELIDLRACHQTMHEFVRGKFDPIIGHLSGTPSVLIAMPLGTLFRGQSGAAAFPTHYKGGLWVYLVPAAGAWEDKHTKGAEDLLKIMWLLLMGTYGAQAEAAREKEGMRRGRIALGHSAPFAISSAIEELIELFAAIDRHRPGLPADIRDRAFPIELYSTAVNAALQHRGRDIESFVRAVPRLPQLEGRVATEGIDREVIDYLSQHIARRLAQLRLAAAKIHSYDPVPVRVVGQTITPAEHWLTDNPKDLQEVAVFLTAVITLIKEAIEHVVRLPPAEAGGPAREARAVKVTLRCSPGPEIEISNPCLPASAMLEYHGGYQEMELETLGRFLRNWAVVEPPEVIDGQWVRRLRRFRRPEVKS